MIAPYTMLNMMAVSPIPRASAPTARPETAGCLRSILSAYRTSVINPAIVLSPFGAAPGATWVISADPTPYERVAGRVSDGGGVQAEAP